MRAFHNLDGWLRDVRAALENRETRCYELADIIEELLDLVDTADGDSGVPDADAPAGREPEPDLEPHDHDGRESLGGHAQGPRPDGSSHVVEPTRVVPPVVHRVRQLARAGSRGTAQPVVRPYRVRA